MIGIYNGKETKTYIKGIDLEEAPAELENINSLFLSTERGLIFLLLKASSGNHKSHPYRSALPFEKIGYSGGLKKIESLLGMRRSDETNGITGFDAVRLWNKYERGNSEALRR